MRVAWASGRGGLCLYISIGILFLQEWPRGTLESATGVAAAFKLAPPHFNKGPHKQLKFAAREDDISTCRTDNEEVRLIRSVRTSQTADDLNTILRSLDLTKSPNVAATALRRSMELQSIHQHHPSSALNHNQQTAVIIQSLSKALIRNIPMTVYATADCLVSFSILYNNNNSNTGSPTELFERYAPIQLLLFGNIQATDVKYLTIKRLIQLIRIARLFIPGTDVQEPYDSFIDRLGHGDLLATMTAKDIHALLSLLDPTMPKERRLIIILAKRIRKTSLRDPSDIATLVSVMQAARRQYNRVNPTMEHDEDVEKSRHKLRTAVTSLAVYIFEREDFNPVLHLVSVLRAIRSLYVRLPHPYIRAIETMQWDPQIFVKASDVAVVLDTVTQYRIQTLNNTVRLAGEYLAVCNHTITPRQANTVLRCAGLLYATDPTVMKSFVALAASLMANSVFLEKCTIGELSNLAWFVAFKASDQSLSACSSILGQQLLKPDLVNNCSPKQACRIISAFARIPMDMAGQDTVRRLYQAYGVHLLSWNLNPAELSSAIYGFAKVDYVHDMGIFDHLVHSMVQRIDLCSTRQCVQALWACGKMFVWEDGNQEGEPPPYLENAVALANRVVRHADDLLTVEVAQSIWALARLSFWDEELLSPLLLRSRKLVNEFSPIEASNILWALAKLKSNDYQTVFLLSRRYAAPISFEMKPKEASTILFAFSQLNIRDEDVFQHVTETILQQMGETSPQIIASVLRAHTDVHIEPPTQLLDQWAVTKLGLGNVAVERG